MQDRMRAACAGCRCDGLTMYERKEALEKRRNEPSVDVRSQWVQAMIWLFRSLLLRDSPVCTFGRVVKASASGADS